MNPFAQNILKLRMAEGLLPKGEIWSDVNTFKPPPDTPAKGCGGGFPCQLSLALLFLLLIVQQFFWQQW